MLSGITENNDGSSYMFFTIVTMLVGCVSIVIEQQAHSRTTQILYSVASALLLLMNGINFVSLFWRLWVRQELELSPRRSFIWTRLVSRIPWQVTRAVDCYIGWSMSISFVLLSLWVWDDTPNKDRHLTFCNHAGCQNIWGAWNMCISQAFAQVSASFPELGARSQLAITLGWLVGSSAWFVMTLTLVVVITAGIQRTAELRRLRKEQIKAQNDSGDRALLMRRPTSSGASASVSGGNPFEPALGLASDDY